MRLRISRAAGLGAALAALPLFAFSAAAQLAGAANENRAVLVTGYPPVPDNPAEDTVTVVDLSASPPKVVGEVKAPSSVVGPPQNVAITPDEGLALVSSNQKLDPADPKKLVADNRLSVIDLKANPPAVIATLELGLAPAGIGMNRAGNLALVANRGEGTVSVLTISGKTVTAAGKVDLGNKTSGPSSAGFPRDGKTPPVPRAGDQKTSMLSVGAP